MLAVRTLLLALVATAACAAPLDAASPAPAARQSTRWNDPYIKQPFGEKAHRLGACTYQITFRRDAVDSRHFIRYYATYPGSSTRVELTDKRGYDSLNSGGTHALTINQFPSACRNGQEPTAFFVRSSDNGGYTYTNDYISPSFAPSTAALPGPPANIRLARVPNTSNNWTATWDAASAASGGYVAQLAIGVYAYELGDFLPGTRAINVPAGRTSTSFRISGRDQLRGVRVYSQAAQDVVSDASRVNYVAA